MADANGAVKSVVVIGNGMVGHKFCEKLLELDADKQYKITTFCEEPRAAYNRMRLTEVNSQHATCLSFCTTAYYMLAGRTRLVLSVKTC